MKKKLTRFPSELIDTAESKYMQAAIEEAYKGITAGDGGPFGAIVVRNGEIIGRGHNRVVGNNDPTCHGEVDAIRNACANLGTFDLTGCQMYTTGEPCPMCLFACKWAKIEVIYYGATIQDNAGIGFRDEVLDRMSGGRDGFEGYLIPLDREGCLKLFDIYMQMEHEDY
ncbi:MAG: nucleoside deaminase [Erysipelotrichaceae bacterium]|nr:nucleoside deaminase [Erysipelotrichaceae bacterium]